MAAFYSTRGSGPAGLEAVLQTGTAPDGGLYVPERLAIFERGALAESTTPAELAQRLLAPYFEGSSLAGALPEICADAFACPLPLVDLSPAGNGARLQLLELFHGPTAAFKDYGARFLSACLERILVDEPASSQPLTILVATSGDTGAAVASAFSGRDKIRVVVLFPKGRISPRQEHHLGCWDENVQALAVHGAFDDCQRLVKQAFADTRLRKRVRLGSANSINLGRLLPQSAYHAWAALKAGEGSHFVVPTGNMGNGVACLWAREMGAGIGRILLTTNANRTIGDYLSSGEYRGRESIGTLANAMDVGDPSNMERLRHHFEGDVERIRAAVSAASVDDERIRRRIRREHEDSGAVLCPHTAAGVDACRDWLADAGAPDGDWVIAATAHPAKFETVVEPLIGTTVAPPPQLEELLSRRSSHEEIPAELAALTPFLG
ncbi:MAG: threonine synthase [Gammaproteobacteria bacterium]|nr:threonine synthase [Gammaproteobacteria bacterium]